MLPRYTKQYDDQDPLLPTPGDGQGRESTENAPPTYPPAGPSTADGRHNVEYSYFPVYPRKGNTEHVVGVLGNTKELYITATVCITVQAISFIGVSRFSYLKWAETIQIVQRGIEGLSTIDPDRMTFKIQLGTGESQHWAKVLDEAWERFDVDPPKRLAIVVADAPGDDHLRTRREWVDGFYIFLIVLACFLFSVGLYILGTSLESAKKAE